jgi:hypothetical protein
MTNENPKPKIKRNVQRAQSWRSPLFEGRERSTWYPDLVGKISGYPKTLEAYQSRQKSSRAVATKNRANGNFNRKGVPDGWAGRKAEVLKERAAAREQAKEIMNEMALQDLLDLPSGTDAEKAHIALTACVEMVLDPTQDSRARQAAAKTVLDFTKPKPAQKQEVVVSRAEDFLAVLARENAARG